MNENEIMNTEIVDTELAETSASAETSTKGLAFAKTLTRAGITIIVYEAGKKFVRWLKSKWDARKKAKAEQSDDVFNNIPNVNDDCFDSNK